MPVDVDIARQIAIAKPCLGEEEWQALREPVLAGWITQGPKVAAFEAAFATRHEVNHAVAVTSCTTALHLALTALGVGPGDEVIVPALTWVATANAVLHCGAKPVFVDVERSTYLLDASRLPEAITPRTRAIIPVHLFGLCADMDAIAAVAGEIPLVEDAACAVGASYHGRPAGSLGRLGCFSFHPRKTITTGEGGMVTTGDPSLAELLVKLRNHGAEVPEEIRHHGPKPYLLPEFNLPGFNYRMTDLQGALGLTQLGRLDALLQERRRWAEFYARELCDIPWLEVPRAADGCGHGWQSYVCLVDEARAPVPRNRMMELLQARGIATRPGTHAVPMLGYYRRRFGLRASDFPVAGECDRSTMAIPLHNQMKADDYHYVVAALKGIG